MPAIIETDDGTMFVTKFRGAGQGAKALIAELITGLLAQKVGLPVPALALIHLDEAFGRSERDPEIQDILKGSRGLNVGLGYLEGAFNFDPLAAHEFITPEFAADLVWFDAYVTNIDRTPRNPNMLFWNRTVQLIDHGASLYFHHNWEGLDERRIHNPFAPIKDHVLMPLAGDLEAADRRMTARLNETVIEEIIALIPDALLMDAPEGQTPPFDTPEANRAAYVSYLTKRLGGPRAFAEEARIAQERQRAARPQPLPYRR